jgi:hypothetical protein
MQTSGPGKGIGPVADQIHLQYGADAAARPGDYSPGRAISVLS